MKLIAVILLLLVPMSARATSLAITGPQRAGLVEGTNYNITWAADGVDIISLVAYGNSTLLGGESRGLFSIPIAENIAANQGSITWTVPFIDSITFNIRITGYDMSGRPIVSADRPYNFRPMVLANRSADGIYLDLHKKTDQRLYVMKSNQIVKAYLSTSSAAYYWLPRNQHINAPHDHAGVFHVIEKTPMHWSKLFNVPMPWAMRYLGGHFIHATKPDYYQYLGAAASSGCNRLHLADAQELYRSTPLGTRVEVIGPNG